MKNWEENVFEGLRVGETESTQLISFLNNNDFADGTRKGIILDMRKFAAWFTKASSERFDVTRVTTRDVTDFKTHLRKERKQAVATINRNLVTIRRYFSWLVDEGVVAQNVAKPVKELRRQQLAPKGIEATHVRKLLREIELRSDIRANAIFSLMLYTGCRVSDLVNLDLSDLNVGEKSGSVTFRSGKGGKQRSVPLCLPVRRTLSSYLETRPQIKSPLVFVGERGPLTENGIRKLCDKYTAIIGLKLTPHLFRHTFAKKYLADNNNDLVGLASLLGHENINTTAIYSRRSEAALSEATENLTY